MRLTNEQIFDLAEPFGGFEYGDSQGHKRLDFARSVEEAANGQMLGRLALLENALHIIASPMRPDGTWNRDREACRQLAEQALKEVK